MALNTSIELRNKIFYQVFVRQFSKKHNFQGVIEKLDEIKALEVDIIQLLPIHPIGEKNRKGNVGSPYSIKNYYEIDPDLGTITDFTRLLEKAHKKGLKVIIAGAGGAAHLPGMVASITPLPVIGVPVKSSNSIDGWDSVLSILQMPNGVPVATVALNAAQNAGILAAQIIATSDKKLLTKIQNFKQGLKEKVIASDKEMKRK